MARSRSGVTKPLQWGLACGLALTLGASAGADVGDLGPAPQSPNGRFVNTIGELDHAGFSVRFPFVLRRIAGTFRSRPDAPEQIPNDGAFLRENARTGTPTITWVGHSTLLVQMDQVSFLTDPIWSSRPSPVRFAGPRRFVDPGIALEDLPPIDFVVVSHNHYDHLDLPSLAALAERDPSTRFLVPLENGDLLRRNGIENVVELDWGESLSVAGLRVHCLPAQHWSKRGLGDDLASLWSSWAVTGPTRRFYFAGDTGYFDGLQRIGAAFDGFDLAAVPIGAYEPTRMMRASHLDPEEAVQAALDLQAKRALAIHFGTFDLSDEPLAEPPRRFREAGEASDLTPDGTWVLRIGETRGF